MEEVNTEGSSCYNKFTNTQVVAIKSPNTVTVTHHDVDVSTSLQLHYTKSAGNVTSSMRKAPRNTYRAKLQPQQLQASFTSVV